MTESAAQPLDRSLLTSRRFLTTAVVLVGLGTFLLWPEQLVARVVYALAILGTLGLLFVGQHDGESGVLDRLTPLLCLLFPLLLIGAVRLDLPSRVSSPFARTAIAVGLFLLGLGIVRALRAIRAPLAPLPSDVLRPACDQLATAIIEAVEECGPQTFSSTELVSFGAPGGKLSTPIGHHHLDTLRAVLSERRWPHSVTYANGDFTVDGAASETKAGPVVSGAFVFAAVLLLAGMGSYLVLPETPVGQFLMALALLVFIGLGLVRRREATTLRERIAAILPLLGLLVLVGVFTSIAHIQVPSWLATVALVLGGLYLAWDAIREWRETRDRD